MEIFYKNKKRSRSANVGLQKITELLEEMFSRPACSWHEASETTWHNDGHDEELHSYHEDNAQAISDKERRTEKVWTFKKSL